MRRSAERGYRRVSSRPRQERTRPTKAPSSPGCGYVAPRAVISISRVETRRPPNRQSARCLRPLLRPIAAPPAGFSIGNGEGTWLQIPNCHRPFRLRRGDNQRGSQNQPGGVSWPVRKVNGSDHREDRTDHNRPFAHPNRLHTSSDPNATGHGHAIRPR